MRWIAGLTAALALGAGTASAEPMTVTFTGTVIAGSSDPLGLFGGGDLAGDPVTQVLTYAQLVKSYQNQVSSELSPDPLLSVSTTINGHTFTFSNDWYFDSLATVLTENPQALATIAVAVEGEQYSTYDVMFAPPSTVAELTPSLILDNSAPCNAPQSGICGGFLDEFTAAFLPSPVQWNISTATISPSNAAIPEPQTWTFLMLGFGVTGGLARARRASGALKAFA